MGLALTRRAMACVDHAQAGAFVGGGPLGAHECRGSAAYCPFMEPVAALVTRISSVLRMDDEQPG